MNDFENVETLCSNLSKKIGDAMYHLCRSEYKAFDEDYLNIDLESFGYMASDFRWEFYEKGQRFF